MMASWDCDSPVCRRRLEKLERLERENKILRRRLGEKVRQPISKEAEREIETWARETLKSVLKKLPRAPRRRKPR